MMSVDVTLLYVVFAFIVSYAILRKFLFSPLSAILDARDAEERSAAELHAASLAALEKTVAEAETRLSQARRDALKQREALRGEGRAHLEKELGTARADAAARVEAAGHEVQTQAQRLSAELPERARALARQLAEKILGRSVAA